jgi:hypothetical protein
MKIVFFLKVGLACVLLLSLSASADVQNITVGGKIEIYGAFYSDFFSPSDTTNAFGPLGLAGRPIGLESTITGIMSDDHHGAGLGFVEQRTRLHLQADFTDGVMAFIEFDSIDTWGEDFRSVDYITGGDMRAATGDDVELYQAFIQVAELWGTPLTLRVGRQELEFGSGWLVGADPGPDPFVGLSFDALRLTYSGESMTADAWWGKTAESMSDWGQDDIDFYGLYLTCTAVESMEFDLYWMYLHDDMNVGQGLGSLATALGDIFGYGNFDSTDMHTVGLRWAGAINTWDWEAEMAYQFGEADSIGAWFRTVPGLFGDDDANFSNWAAHAEVGYSFDNAWTPRLYLGGSYYGGEDNRDITFLESINPFDEPAASVSFHRLFSAYREDDLIDGSAMSNFWKLYIGVSGTPTEKIELGLKVTYLSVVEEFDRPVFFAFPWWTNSGDNDLGWQTGFTAAYQYSDDLSFELGYTHFFTGGAIEDGSFIDGNGLLYVGGFDDDDVDYVYGMMSIEF